MFDRCRDSRERDRPQAAEIQMLTSKEASSPTQQLSQNLAVHERRCGYDIARPARRVAVACFRPPVERFNRSLKHTRSTAGKKTDRREACTGKRVCTELPLGKNVWSFWEIADTLPSITCQASKRRRRQCGCCHAERARAFGFGCQQLPPSTFHLPPSTATWKTAQNACAWP